MLLPAVLHTERLQIRRPRRVDGLRVAEAIGESLQTLRRRFAWAEALAAHGAFVDYGARAVIGAWRFDEQNAPVLFVWQGDDFVGEVAIDNRHWRSDRAAGLRLWIRDGRLEDRLESEVIARMVTYLFEVEGTSLVEVRLDADERSQREAVEALGFERVGPEGEALRFVLTAESAGRPAEHLGVVVLTHPECLEHEVRKGASERPERLDAVLEGLRGLDVTMLGAPRGTVASVALAHPEHHLEEVEDQQPVDGIIQLDADTDLGPNSVNAALRGVGGAVAGVDLVRDGRADNVFVVTRPPGHHATRERPMGFCLFATAAIGALHAVRVRRLKRVALLDIDVHHGNGSQDVLKDEPRVLFVSTHEAFLYPRSGAASETGCGNVLNVPLEPRTTSKAYRRRFSAEVLPRLTAFAPELIILSAGFDAHRRDEHSTMALDAEDYRWITRQITGLAPVVSVLEGGYELVALALSARAHVEALIEASQNRSTQQRTPG